jgi:diguanylate cyclase (GGDEF)-like protein/PAS domain S-box-containing protein
MHTRLNAQLTDYSKSIEQSANQSLALLHELESYTTKNILVNNQQQILSYDSVKQSTQRYLTGITELSGITENIGITFENQQPLIYPPVYSKQDIRLNRFVTGALQLNDELSSTPTAIQILPASPLIEGGMTVLAQKSLYQKDQRLAILFLEININKLIESSGLNTAYNDLSFEITDQTGKRIYANHLEPLDYTETHQFTIANNIWQIKATCTISDEDIQQKVTIFQCALASLLFLMLALVKTNQTRLSRFFPQQIVSFHNKGSNKNGSPSLQLPLLITIAIIFIFICFYLLLKSSENNTANEQLLHTKSLLKSSITSQLAADKAYLLLISDQITDDKMDGNNFEQRLSNYLYENPRLSNITWYNADLSTTKSVPSQSKTLHNSLNQSINRSTANSLPLSLKASLRAFQLAKLTAKPIYTAPFNIIHNKTRFELYVPIFKNKQFVGALKASYPLKDLLKQEVISNVLSLYRITFLNDMGQTLSLIDSAAPTTDLSTTFALDTLNQQVWFSLISYEGNASTHRLMLFFIFILGIAVSFFFWWQYRVTRLHWIENKSLRDSFEHFQLIAKASPMAILITQLDSGKITFANDRAGKLFLYDTQAMIGVRIIDLYWDPSEQTNKKALFNEQGYIESFELRVKRSDNSFFWASISSKIIQLHDKNLIISSIIDLSAQKLQESKLLQQANYDSLTGLANRSLAFDRLQQAIKYAKRKGNNVVLMMLDLDNFKDVNDSLGHNYGDLLLQKIANKLKLCCRESDTVARLGGDEFTFILPDLDNIEIVDHIATNILAVCEKPMYIQGQEMRISASVGISIYPKDGHDQQTLLKNADIAMYQCKDKGRNHFRYYNEQMSEQAKSRMRMELQIRRALNNNEFTLNYQPLICVNSRSAKGAEALLRWNNLQLGQVPPDVFIPLAESIGLIDEIGYWVLRTACKQIKQWRKQDNMPRFVAVNVSSHQLRKDDFIDRIKELLAEFDLPAKALELEITESTLLENSANNLQKLEAIHSLGVRLSIDDFGTGYSSLSYLQRFSFDTLKIDKSFIQNITIDPKVEQIVTAILSMAKVLELKVVAEGVENKEQLTLLAKLGCPIVQGYYFAKPTPAKDLKAIAHYE